MHCCLLHIQILLRNSARQANDLNLIRPVLVKYCERDYSWTHTTVWKESENF